MNFTRLFANISVMKKINIFQTFETFMAEPLSIIRDRIIQICHVEAEGVDVQNKIQFNLSDQSAQINVYNSPGAYNLLSAVLYKKKILNGKNDNQTGKISNERTESLTMSKL